MSNHENMDDKDFYAFRKSLEHQRDIEFDAGDWEALNQRLNEAAGGKRRPALGWWLAAAAAVLVLLLGNIFLFGNLHEMRKTNEQLHGKLQQLPSNHTDTVWREKIVHVRDTLFKEKIVYRAVPAVPEKYRQLEEIFTPGEIETLLAGKLPERLRALPGETAPAKVEGLAGTAGQEMKAHPETPVLDLNYVPDLLENSSIGLLESRSKARPDWEGYLSAVNLEKKKTPLLLKIKRAMQPEGLAIGPSGGALLPIAKELDQPGGWATGLAGEVLFSNHLRLRAEVNYVQISYNSNSMDPNLGIPVIASPGDDFVFDKAQVVQDALQFDFVMKYLMNVHKKLQPFIYAGYGTASIFPYKVYYDFKNTVTENEVQVEDEIGSTYFISGFGMAGAGLSYRMSGHVSLQLDGYYRSQLRKSSLSNPDLAGLRANLLYQF